MSALDTRSDLRSLRFRFLSFFVKIWDLNAFIRLSLPLAVLFMRLAAPRCVFIFGISISVFPGPINPGAGSAI
jgi:hypothetical protein